MQWLKLANGNDLSAKGAESIGLYLLSKASIAAGDNYGLRLPTSGNTGMRISVSGWPFGAGGGGWGGADGDTIRNLFDVEGEGVMTIHSEIAASLARVEIHHASLAVEETKQDFKHTLCTIYYSLFCMFFLVWSYFAEISSHTSWFVRSRRNRWYILPSMWTPSVTCVRRGAVEGIFRRR